MFVQFGISAMLVNPSTTYGNNATPKGPGQFLTLQDVGIEWTGQLVPLKGQSKYCDDIAAGDVECKGTANFGRIDPYYINSFILGDTQTEGLTTATQAAVDELHAIPATPFQVVGTHTTAVEDLGVRIASTGQPMQLVASSPAAGQYSVAVSTGTITYTFSSADNVSGLSVLISYSYTATADSLTIANHPMGYGPICEIFIPMTYSCPIDSSGKNLLHLFAVRFGDWGLPQKRDAHVISKLTFQAFPNPAGNVAEIVTGNI
jgi:hypothetical protein